MSAPSGSEANDHGLGMEAAAATHGSAFHEFALYIAGTTPQSTRAIVNTRKICEEHLTDRYHLEIIDICQNPAIAERDQIIAAPTLVRRSPLPLRRFIGDMSRTAHILSSLGLPTHPTPAKPGE